MKKYIRLISILFILGVTGCNKFLDVTPKNVISMDDLQSIKQAFSGFLNGMSVEGYGYNFELPISPLEPSPRNGVLVAYSREWDLSLLAADEEGLTVEDVKKADWRNESTQGFWGRYYETIGFMNLLIHEAETASGEEDMRDYLMGEAYIIRAYCFFKLIQYYAPYDNDELGIPLCLESYDDFENVDLSRKPQARIYAQILSDLRETEIRLGRTPTRETFNVMYKSSVLNRLLAEVYQYKALSPVAEVDDWKNAILYASKETEGATLESDLDRLYSIFNTQNANSKVVNTEAALRINFSSGYQSVYIFRGLKISDDFYESYFPASEGDIRREFIEEVQTYEPGIGWTYKLALNKFSTDYQYNSEYGNIFIGFRLAEAFLIQAEALAMTDQLNEARGILDRFKQARYTGSYTIPSDKESLLQDIYRERCKEFMGEADYGWLDMKRLGLKVERVVGNQTFTLEGIEDYRYTFPIPTMELENNKFLDQNPGWQLKD